MRAVSQRAIRNITLLVVASSCDPGPMGAPPTQRPPPIELQRPAPSAYVVTPSPTSTAVGDDSPSSRLPSGHFLVGKQRLAEIRARAKQPGWAAWDALLANVDGAVKSNDSSNSSIANLCVVYLVTKDKTYGETGYKWFEKLAKEDVRRDSYLFFGDLMRGAAEVLVDCGDALTPAQKTTIAEYLEKWTNELWWDNKGSGWGLADPGNNYHYAFLEGTAYAAYALDKMKRPSAKRLLDLLKEKIEGPNGSLAYLSGQGKGGDWHEGANYGERSKQRMFDAFSAIASMGGPNYFARTPFTNEAIRYVVYQTQPGRAYLAPTGDLARVSRMDVTPFERDYVQAALNWTSDPLTRGIGAWYLREVTPSYVMPSLAAKFLLHRDVLIATPGEYKTPKDALPLGYRSKGTDWLNARSSWDDDATSLTVVASQELDQSHAHIDLGSFVIWKNGWQAADAGSYEPSGLLWTSGAHNMIHVPGHMRRTVRSKGLVKYVDDGALFYAQMDETNAFVQKNGDSHDPMLDEWTRELVYVRPSAFVVYDRVAPKASAKDYTWRMHFPKKPSGEKGRYKASNEGGSITVTMLEGGEEKIVSDDDMKSSAWRLEVRPAASHRFLAFVDVSGRGERAELVSGNGVRGAVWSDRVVVASAEPFGKSPSLPFDYKVKDTGRREHILVDMPPSCEITVNRGNGMVTVHVSPGTKTQASPDGIVRFKD